jgi:uncharacterized C2H2 Zn-finger protein
MIAKAQHGRSHYGESGLRCLRCRRLFERAREFVSHSCFAEMLSEQAREEERRAPRGREERGQLRLFSR